MHDHWFSNEVKVDFSPGHVQLQFKAPSKALKTPHSYSGLPHNEVGIPKKSMPFCQPKRACGLVLEI